MTECRRVADALVEYAFGELGEKEGEQVESHLRGCLACQADVLRYRLLARLVRQLPPFLPQADEKRWTRGAS